MKKVENGENVVERCYLENVLGRLFHFERLLRTRLFICLEGGTFDPVDDVAVAVAAADGASRLT